MKDSTKVLVVIALVAVLLTVLYTIVMIVSIPGGWAARAQFGDAFGALNALFSGLALAGVIYAVLLQRQELALQRIELNANTQAQKQQAKALSYAAELNVLSASVESLGMQLRHLKSLLGEEGEPDLTLTPDDRAGIREDIRGLQQELLTTFARIRQLRADIHQATQAQPTP